MSLLLDIICNGFGVTVTGCVVPETLNGTKHVPWFEAGATIFDKNGIQYLGIPGLINARSILATLIVQVTDLTSHSQTQYRDLQARTASVASVSMTSRD